MEESEPKPTDNVLQHRQRPWGREGLKVENRGRLLRQKNIDLSSSKYCLLPVKFPCLSLQLHEKKKREGGGKATRHITSFVHEGEKSKSEALA